MIIQPSLSELARQGNPKAIASLITHSLKAQGITAKASLKEECFHVPNQYYAIASRYY